MYLTYDEYTDLGGTLDETAFQDVEFDAETDIDWYTFSRLKKPEWSGVLESEDLKRCMYQLIRLKQMENDMLASSGSGAGFGVGWTKEAGITSQSNDGVLTTYNTISSGELLTFFTGKRTKKTIVKKYLNGLVDELGRNILFRGLYPGE